MKGAKVEIILTFGQAQNATEPLGIKKEIALSADPVPQTDPGRIPQAAC